MTACSDPPCPQQRPLLVSLRDIHLSFGAASVLRGISLDIHQGEAVSIIGPSGSGKSTILRCINGLVVPQKGKVTFGETDVTALRTEAERIRLRKKIGFVFQQFNLFPHLTVLENIVIAPIRILGEDRRAAEARGRELLARVHLSAKETAYPGQLSGGQQQRVAIARALAMRPDLVLFDEVTSSLDPEMVGEVLSVIRELVAEGLTCVLVTHEMRFAEEISDRVVFTEHGEILVSEPPSQIFGGGGPSRVQAFLKGLGEAGRA
jgi:polar amino acid transport system ATP-binding protein